jgi:TolA-binding protein
MVPQAAPVRTPQDVLRSAGMPEHAVRRVTAEHGDGLSYASAMGLAAFYQRLVSGGIPTAAASEMAAAQPPRGMSQPHDQADAVVSFVDRALKRGMDPTEAIAAAVALWTKDPRRAPAAAESIPASRGPAVPGQPMPIDTSGTVPIHEVASERRSMADQEKRNGAERERDRLEREREKLEREREKLERLQEEMQERIESQQERLEELQDELDAREDELEEREQEIEELEVEGAEGVREVLDVVSERIPNLMRGIQETVYSPEIMKKTSDALVAFFKNLVDAGMDADEAAEMTKLQMAFMQTPGLLAAGPRRRVTRLRPSRPSRPGRPGRPSHPTEPAETAEPTEAEEEDED